MQLSSFDSAVTLPKKYLSYFVKDMRESCFFIFSGEDFSQ